MKKLRLAGVASYEAANRFLEEGYMTDHNRRFARPAASAADFHRKRPSKRELDDAFQLEPERVVSLDRVVIYEGRLLQLNRQNRHHTPAKKPRVGEGRTKRENCASSTAVATWASSRSPTDQPVIPFGVLCPSPGADTELQPKTTLGSKATCRCPPFL